MPRSYDAITEGSLAWIWGRCDARAQHGSHLRRTVARFMRVMTRNLFLGADLTPAYRALAAPDALTALPGRGGGHLQPGRAAGRGAAHGLRDARRRPRRRDRAGAAGPDRAAGGGACGGSATPSPPTTSSCWRPSWSGAGCAIAASPATVNGDVALPSAAGILVGLSDREAILAREDAELTLANVQSAGFATMLPVQTPQGAVGLARGWMSVDATLRGTTVRFISTHLEVSGTPAAAAVQLAPGRRAARRAGRHQPARRHARRLQRPSRAPDLRRAAGGRLRRRVDPRQPGRPRRASPAATRERLDDPADTLRARIDLILTRGAIAATEAFLVGAEPATSRAAGCGPPTTRGSWRRSDRSDLYPRWRCGSRSSPLTRGATPEE